MLARWGALCLAITLCLGCSSKRERRSRIDSEETNAAHAEAPVGPAGPVIPSGDPSRIPARALSIRRFSTRYYQNLSPAFREPAVPAAAWSRLGADDCGGPDIYLQIINAGAWSSSGSTVGAALADPTLLKQQLACGRAEAEALGPTVFRVRFETLGSANAFVAMLELGDGPLARPSKLHLEDVHGPLTSLVCRSKDSCSSPTSNVSGRVGGTKTWLRGDLANVEGLAGWLADDKRALHPKAKELAALGERVAGARSAEVGVASAFNLQIANAVGASGRAMGGIEQKPFSVDFRKALVDRGVLYALGDDVTPAGGALTIFLAPAAESDVEPLMADTKRWIEELGKHLASIDESFLGSFGISDDERHFNELYPVWALRSVKAATVTRDGAAVRLQLERQLTDAEKALVDKARDLARKRSIIAVEVIERILDDRPVTLDVFDGIEVSSFKSDVAAKLAKP